MLNSKFKIVLIISVFLSAFFILGCGSGDDSSNSTTVPAGSVGNEYFWVSQQTCENFGVIWDSFYSNCATSPAVTDPGPICQAEDATLPSMDDLKLEVEKCGGTVVIGDDLDGIRWNNYNNSDYQSCIQALGFDSYSSVTWTSSLDGTDWWYFESSYGRFRTDTGGWPKIFYCVRSVTLIADTTAPDFISSPTASVNENQTNAITLAATDVSAVTYSISGGDSAAFNINSTTGVVTFKVAPDFEIKSSYTFIATASDVTGNSRTQNVTITILDVYEVVDTTPPTFTSIPTASVNENQTSAITLAATDDISSVTYSISGGDSIDFQVNSSTGVVSFQTPPDYETQQNYSFMATATDTSNNSVTQNVAITILDVLEITQNGVVYLTVTSPYTGRTWLDKNLGASRACTTYNDSLCFGDYYQWGRNTDGHEKRTSLTTLTKAADINNAGADFIVDGSSPYEWAATDTTGALRSANWSKIDGTSVCPAGYRVPTNFEIIDELTDSVDGYTDNIDAFNNFLKLPSSGFRDAVDGGMTMVNTYSSLWSSTFNATYTTSGYWDTSAAAHILANTRAYGRSVRCIKNY